MFLLSWLQSSNQKVILKTCKTTCRASVLLSRRIFLSFVREWLVFAVRSSSQLHSDITYNYVFKKEKFCISFLNINTQCHICLFFGFQYYVQTCSVSLHFHYTMCITLVTNTGEVLFGLVWIRSYQLRIFIKHRRWGLLMSSNEMNVEWNQFLTH